MWAKRRKKPIIKVMVTSSNVLFSPTTSVSHSSYYHRGWRHNKNQFTFEKLENRFFTLKITEKQYLVIKINTYYINVDKLLLRLGYMLQNNDGFQQLYNITKIS